jgi:hypothetical protein
MLPVGMPALSDSKTIGPERGVNAGCGPFAAVSAGMVASACVVTSPVAQTVTAIKAATMATVRMMFLPIPRVNLTTIFFLPQSPAMGNPPKM